MKQEERKFSKHQRKIMLAVLYILLFISALIASVFHYVVLTEILALAFFVAAFYILSLTKRNYIRDLVQEMLLALMYIVIGIIIRKFI